MQTIHRVVYLSLLLLFSSTLSAQDIQISFRIVDPILAQEGLNTIYLSDTEIATMFSGEFQKPIFEVQIGAMGDPLQPNIAYENCEMFLSIKKDDAILASWYSDPFIIPSQPEPYILPNEQLINNTFYFDPANSATRVRIHERESTDDLTNLQTEALSSGTLPIGNYTLEIQLNYAFNSQTYQKLDVFPFLSTTNPSYVQLVSPGNYAGGMDAITIFNEFPVFQFAGNGDEYQVVVFEKKNDFQTVDDVINSRENWQSDPGPELSVIYPQGGNAIPLEYGKTYYWMVRMFIVSTSGTNTINSEVWQFRLGDPANPADQQALISKNDLMAFLKDLLGDQADEIAASLTDYEVATIRVNGTEMTIQELYNLLNTYRNQKIQIEDIVLPGSSN